VPNASVTCLHLPSTDADPAASWSPLDGAKPFRVRAELLNDTAHLGMQRLRQFAAKRLAARL
jgi:hypothetical protein